MKASDLLFPSILINKEVYSIVINMGLYSIKYLFFNNFLYKLSFNLVYKNTFIII